MKPLWETAAWVTLGSAIGLPAGSLFSKNGGGDGEAVAHARARSVSSPDKISLIRRGAGKRSLDEDGTGVAVFSVPRADLVKLLRSRLRGLGWRSLMETGEPCFDIESLLEALSTLNATEDERREVIAVFQRAFNRLGEVEARHLTLGEVEPTRISLDTERLDQPLQDIGREAADGLLAAMPDERGEVLSESVPWNGLYHGCGFGPEIFVGVEVLSPQPVSFEIERGRDGTLCAVVHSGMNRIARFLPPDLYPQDGTPIPADKVFDPRWGRWLAGQTLMPKEPP